MALIKCDECNHDVSNKAASCPNCGAPISKTASKQQFPIIVTPPKSRSLAIALSLFLGGLGIHKFYVNQPFWGVLYLVFCWTFIPAILGVLEAIVWLFTSEKSFQKQYGPKT